MYVRKLNRKENSMKLYLVTADTYDDMYGAMISCFGIATNEESLKVMVKKAEEEGFLKITEVDSDSVVEEYLGGYYK
jgi:hypothetical protein